jgi:hypothetical protein
MIIPTSGIDMNLSMSMLSILYLIISDTGCSFLNTYMVEDLRTYPGTLVSQAAITYSIAWQQTLHDSLVWNRPLVPASASAACVVVS